MANATKKRIQVQVNNELADETEAILDDLGLTPTAAITMFFKRIVATKGLPFSTKLTDRETAQIELIKATRSLPVKEIKTVDEYNNWVENGND